MNTQRLGLSLSKDEEHYKQNMRTIDRFAYTLEKKAEGLNNVVGQLGYVFMTDDEFFIEIKISEDSPKVMYLQTYKREKNGEELVEHEKYTEEGNNITVNDDKVPTKKIEGILDFQGFNYIGESYTLLPNHVQIIGAKGYEAVASKDGIAEWEVSPFDKKWTYGSAMVKKVVISSSGQFKQTFLQYNHSLGGYYIPVTYGDDGSYITFDKIMAGDAPNSVKLTVPTRVYEEAMMSFDWDAGNYSFTPTMGPGYVPWFDDPNIIPSIHYKVYEEIARIESGDIVYKWEEVDVSFHVWWSSYNWVFSFYRVDATWPAKVCIWVTGPEQTT